MADTKELALENKAAIEYLADTFDEGEKRSIIRDMFIVTQIKQISVKVEEEYTYNGVTKTKMVTTKRKMNPYEALAYVMLCRDLGFNPALDMVTMLEDKFYIGLEGHKTYAQKTGACYGIDATMLEEKEIDYVKKGWDGKADTTQKGKQYKFQCIVKKKIGDDILEYKGIGIADPSNVVGGDKASDLKLMQMAEARSKRRALDDAFPPGVGHVEDVYESPDYNLGTETPQIDSPQATKNPLEVKIAEAKSIAELEALKPEITKSKSNDMVKVYAQRQKELKQTTVDEFIAQRQKEPETVGPDYLKQAKERIEKGSTITPEELDAEDRERADRQMVLDDEANRIKELKEELEEEV